MIFELFDVKECCDIEGSFKVIRNRIVCVIVRHRNYTKQLLRPSIQKDGELMLTNPLTGSA